jgi:hypothetical protein
LTTFEKLSNLTAYPLSLPAGIGRYFQQKNIKMDPQYQRQLDYIFNRPTTEPEWYWGNDSVEHGEFGEENPISYFTFLETLFLNPAHDLKPYSDDQIGLGLNFIFNSSCSNMTHGFLSAPIPFERKIKAINTLFALFRDVLNPRTPEILSAFSQEKLSKIGYVCYMFWDISPMFSAANFSFLEAQIKTEAAQKPYKNSKREIHYFYTAIANVMKQCLDLSNPACVESGLHGLGHLAFNHPKIAVPIIDNFLKNGKCENENLISYAKMARTGMIA